jgi:hypothetical protein
VLGPPNDQFCEITFLPNLAAIDANGIFDSARRAHQSDLAHFEPWGGQLAAIPAFVASCRRGLTISRLFSK